MRLVSYNILKGGVGRADPLAEVLRAQKPDVVVLVEADDPEVLERISARLEMDCIAAQGLKHCVAVLSRLPIVHSVNHAVLCRGPDCFLEVLLRQPAGQEWLVGAVHLHPHAFEADEQRREWQLRGLLQVFADARAAGRPHLLAGDFNANAPGQVIDPGRLRPITRQAWSANGGQIPRRVIQMLLDAGYVDTLAAACPDTAPISYSLTTGQPGQRLDYIFTYGLELSRIRSAWIEQDPLARYASDHFPVGVELA